MKQSIKTNASQMQVAALAALGLLVIAVLLWIGLSSPAVSCGGKTGSPAAAFQSASSATDLENIFGVDSSECRAALVKGLKGAAMADLFLFIPAYSLFLAWFAAIINGRTKAATLLLAAALVATIVGDVLETATQLIILDKIDNGAHFLVSLSIGNMLKTFGLAFVLLTISHALWKQGSRYGRFFASLLGLCALFRIAAYASEPMRSLAPLSALFAYIVMFACIIGFLVQLRCQGGNRAL